MKIITGLTKILKIFFVVGLVFMFVVAAITLLTKEEPEN